MIELRQISKSINGHQILDNLSLKFNEREMVCLIGSMGCGKSTLLRCIDGLVKLDAGEITFASGQRPRIGMIFQHFNLFPHLNVLQNLTLAPIKVLGMSAEDAANLAMEQLKSVGLAHKSQQFPHDLSVGQQQRVAIARCMVMNPQIILLDEPLSSLDPIATGEVMDVLRNLKAEPGKVVAVTLDAVSCRERSYPGERAKGVDYWINVYCSPYRHPKDLVAMVGGQWKECEQADVNLCFSGQERDDKDRRYQHARPDSLFTGTDNAANTSAHALMLQACKRLNVGNR